MKTAATAHTAALAADAKVAASTKALAAKTASRAEVTDTIVDNRADWNLESREITTDQFAISLETKAVAAAKAAMATAPKTPAKLAALKAAEAKLAASQKDLAAAVKKGNFDKIKLSAAQNVQTLDKTTIKTDKKALKTETKAAAAAEFTYKHDEANTPAGRAKLAAATKAAATAKA